MQMLHLAHPDKARTAGGCGLPSNLLTCAWINRTSSCDTGPAAVTADAPVSAWSLTLE